ncbi:1-phosphofructokinase family hexose kinase [Paractinoplanes hotanensis]|uniref:PfkB family carbohydrate kinase n=1 Tax=Paractinoplanes hotanensis TaxID=2906497 RepID=A0ABT0Y0P4_9ACTN|nr:PfkB family carbohydrate kinase [Actinoplanes hotanensis]MCM4079591.1 PfkB family carbohydrate kinase [Actinoplanes hotanensis]
MTDRVMVFAPAPILTVTIEQRSGEPDLHVHPGGQGVWQARMISALGVPVMLCAALGGEPGSLLEAVLAGEDFDVRSVTRQSASGWYVHDRRDGQREPVAEHAGRALDRHELDELHNVALTEGLRSSVAVLSGPHKPSVVDAAVYRRLAADLTANGVRVVADLSGDYLTAVLEGGVSFVKVSHEELLDDGLADDDSVESLLAAGRKLRGQGVEAVLISRAAEPALAIWSDTECEVHPPPLSVNEHRGAGDSMTAGVASVLARGEPVASLMEQALRTGSAAGALNVTRHGLGTGRAEAVHELMSRVRIEPL